MPSQSIDQLLDGFRRFRETYYAENRPLFDALARQGQSPKVLVIGCADSRVDPLLITGAAPGDLFVVRNVANLVPPYAPDEAYHGTSAAIEFAVRGLEVEHVIVLGHSQCGGVRALLDGAPLAGRGDDFIVAWMAMAEPARRCALDPALPEQERLRTGELETVKISIANLVTFPWIRRRVEEKRLALHGWYFDLAHGRLLELDPATGDFRDTLAPRASADRMRSPLPRQLRRQT